MFINIYICEFLKIKKDFETNEIFNLCLEFCNVEKLPSDIKNLLMIQNKKDNLNSVDIDEFINRFNCYMYKNDEDLMELDYLYKLCKKLKKTQLQELIKMINEDLVNSNQEDKMINENSKRKNDLLLKINNFIIDPSNFDIAHQIY